LGAITLGEWHLSRLKSGSPNNRRKLTNCCVGATPEIVLITGGLFQGEGGIAA